MSLNESIVEDAALEWFGELGYAVGHGPHLAPGEPAAERDGFGEVVLVGRLREAIRRLNPAIPEEAREEALRKVLRVGTPALVQTNRAFHRMLRDGVPVEYPRPDGSIAGDHVRLIDFDDVRANDWLAVNQFTVIEGQHNRRPDIVVFVNGLPLGLIELKNASNEDATIWSAYAQLQTYKAEIPTLLHYNAALVVSDGLQARMGSITANQEWFKIWREPNDSPLPSPPAPLPKGEGRKHYRGGFDFAGLVKRAREMREKPTTAEELLWSLLRGRQLENAKFRRQHQFGEYITDFFCAEAELVVECDGEVHNTPERQKIDKQRDAYLRSQGLTVLRFQNERILTEPLEILRQISEHLPSTSGRGAGGEGNVAPKNRNQTLSERRNIIVIADEAHRSQYDLIDGLARHMRDALPNASFIGFTGTPIEKTDANTRAVFGDYISIYDIQRAVADKATVPIYYESRISKLSLNAAELPKIDTEFEQITEGEELTKKEKLKTKWAALEALVGDPKRIALIAADLVAHWEKRLDAMDGKAMIVCMSRRICVDLYDALIKLRPEWETEALKIVMTGSADDGPEWQKHIRSKDARRKLANRFKDPQDPFKIVIVRDMWLTGIDFPGSEKRDHRLDAA